MATKVETDLSILNQIGNTPLVKLDSLTNDNVTYFAKLEGHNPFGSVKDRAAYWMIKDAEERGILKKGHSIIIEPTSENTGIALTGIAKLLGYGVGTGGTITGIGTYLKEKNPNIKIIGCQPQKNHLIQGWRNFEESAKPALF